MSTFGSPNSDVPDLVDFAKRLAERQQASQVRPQVRAEPEPQMAELQSTPSQRSSAVTEQIAPRTEQSQSTVQRTETQPATQSPVQVPQQESPVMRDILNALHLIHDEAVQIRTIIERLTQ